MATIQLSNCNFSAIVDDDKLDLILSVSRNWRLGARGYAICGGSKRVTLMHRVVLEIYDGGIVVDHVNGNKLDNRACNLRLCTKAENCRNARLSRRNKSGFKGVSSLVNGKYVAQIGVSYKNIYLGTYLTAQDAAAAYNTAAEKYHGAFARTNEL